MRRFWQAPGPDPARAPASPGISWRAALEAEVAEIIRHKIMTTDLGADGLASAARVAASAAAPAITSAILLHGGTLPDDGAASGWAALKESIAAVIVARILSDVPVGRGGRRPARR
jgi:hypothetical protein